MGSPLFLLRCALLLACAWTWHWTGYALMRIAGLATGISEAGDRRLGAWFDRLTLEYDNG